MSTANELVQAMIGPMINISLIGIIGYFIKTELNGIKDRLTRIENTYFIKGD